MRPSEEEIVKRYEDQGCVVLSRGWPDYYVLHPNESGKFEFLGTKFDVLCVEVKRPGQKVPFEQLFVHAILRSYGIETRSERP